ncbi:MAG TPA: hypothetical protein DCQ37_00180 [Desulfobacteraceae bacterium]|nr:hypothetical protein [Desulfobacteraceae bacterium]
MDVSERDSLIKEQLSRLFLMISDGKLGEAKQLTTELRDNIGNAPELVKADVIIRRKEIIGR